MCTFDLSNDRLPTNKYNSKGYSLTVLLVLVHFVLHLTMKIKSLLFFTTVFVFLSCFLVVADPNDQQHVLAPAQGDSPTAGLPLDISPEQLESLDNEKFTFQVLSKETLEISFNGLIFLLYRLKYRV